MAGDGWTTIRLGEVCTKIGSGATPRGGSGVYLDSGPYALIRSGFTRDGDTAAGGAVHPIQQNTGGLLPASLRVYEAGPPPGPGTVQRYDTNPGSPSASPSACVRTAESWGRLYLLPGRV